MFDLRAAITQIGIESLFESQLSETELNHEKAAWLLSTVQNVATMFEFWASLKPRGFAAKLRRQCSHMTSRHSNKLVAKNRDETASMLVS